MTALAEQLARDPTANPEVVNRVDGNAARARAALAELASGSKSAKAVSLHHYLEDRTSA